MLFFWFVLGRSVQRSQSTTPFSPDFPSVNIPKVPELVPAPTSDLPVAKVDPQSTTSYHWNLGDDENETPLKTVIPNATHGPCALHSPRAPCETHTPDEPHTHHALVQYQKLLLQM